MKLASIVLNPLWVVALSLMPVLVRCGGDEAASAAQCDDWSHRASSGRRTEQDQAKRDCSADADCEIVDYGLSCFADCGYPSAVATSGVPALEAAIDALDHDNCDRFEAASCPGPIIPPCVPPIGTPTAVCRNGQCTVERTP
jgi:hypothetical protein